MTVTQEAKATGAAAPRTLAGRTRTCGEEFAAALDGVVRRSVVTKTGKPQFDYADEYVPDTCLRDGGRALIGFDLTAGCTFTWPYSDWPLGLNLVLKEGDLYAHLWLEDSGYSLLGNGEPTQEALEGLFFPDGIRQGLEEAGAETVRGLNDLKVRYGLDRVKWSIAADGLRCWFEAYASGAIEPPQMKGVGR